MTKDTEAREKVARLIAAGNHGDPWWWKQAFDDGSDETAVRLRADDVSVADTILAALATPATNELGFDPTAEVGDEVFPHDERNDSYKYKVRIVPGPPDLPEAPATSRKIVDGVDLGPVSQPYPGADDLILAPCSCGFCGNPTPVDPAAGGEALREKVARIIADGSHGDPWWWKAAFDDGREEIAVRLREDDLALACTILAALKGPAA